MKIAVTSKDGLSVSGHAGHCKGFLVYEVEGTRIGARTRVELSAAQTLHASNHHLPESLGGISVLVSGGMGTGLSNKLLEVGVEPVVTSELDPDRAVAALLAGTLAKGAPHAHGEAGHSCGH